MQLLITVLHIRVHACDSHIISNIRKLMKVLESMYMQPFDFMKNFGFLVIRVTAKTESGGTGEKLFDFHHIFSDFPVCIAVIGFVFYLFDVVY